MIPYGMKQDDARKLDHATLEAMRIRAVRSVQAGENPEVVARSLRISRRTIYGWLAQYRRGGWGALKALHRAQERDEALVEQWLKKEYPKIKALAQREKAEIFFGDAAHMRSDHHAGRSWRKKGETPVVETTGARHGMSLI